MNINETLDTDNFRVFDNGGESLDRYTLFPYLESKDINERVMHIGFSEGGIGFSQWGEINKCDIHNLEFLGNELQFIELSTDSQNHIINRLKD